MMIGKKPYLLRALHEWIVDNGWTPHLVVDTETNPVSVPEGYAKDGFIVLNISMGAVQGLELGNDMVSFSARFSGKSFSIWFPIESVAGIYARENNEGLQFVVSKVDVDSADEEEAVADAMTSRPSLELATPNDDTPSGEVGADDTASKTEPERARPKLTVVSNRSTDDD